MPSLFCVFVCAGVLKKRMLENFSASDDIGKCRPTIVLKATESFSNADLYEIYTNGYRAAHKCQIDKRQHNWLCFIGNRGQPLMTMLTMMITLMLKPMTGVDDRPGTDYVDVETDNNKNSGVDDRN